MTIATILLILFSLIVAGGLSYYHYFYKAKSKSKVHLLLAFLRFFTILGILLLLINPKITRQTYEVQKTPLPIVIDNSSSIIALNANQNALNLFQKLTTHKALGEKFDVQSYQFDTEMELSDKFDFKGTQTNVESVAKNLKNSYRNKTFPTVLITDGNQTSGNDYVYSFDPNNKVYPLILGDTATVLDLRIDQLNVNKYAFHKNQFPVEVFLRYSGTQQLTANFSISQGNSVLNRQSVSFSPSKKSVVLKVLLPANSVGLQVFKASLTSGETERNTYNNSKNFAVEVIDQKSEIAIVSAISHPDIGVLKRSIETNQQRKVTVVKPNEIKSLQDYNVLILYQPSFSFKALFEANKKANRNTWIITGTNTDFAFLNQQQTQFEFKMSGQAEDYLADFNGQFNLFALDNIGFDHFPPLQHSFGTITSKENTNVLLSSKIRNIATNAPLLAFSENQGKRSAFLFGENIWKWRIQYYQDHQSFEQFDVFIDKTIQFLSTNTSKKALIVNHESFYNSGEAIAISAQFFNKNYELDEKARLTIAVSNQGTNQVKQYDLLRNNTAFKVNLDGLAAGKYQFTVKELNSNSTYSGHFEILDFDIENQFVNPDWVKLNQLAEQTLGRAYMPDQAEELIQTLLENEEYKTVQKSIIRKVPLIDSILLLVLLVITLGSEWFIRKYNGMV